MLAETVIDALDDSGSSKHGGYETKEARRLRRQRRLERAGRSGTLSPRSRTEENAEYVLKHLDFLNRLCADSIFPRYPELGQI